MQDSNNVSKMIGSLLVGAITGAAIGVLFAPSKGSKTRHRLMNGAKDMADEMTTKLKEEVAALRQKADEMERAAKDKMHDMTNQLKHKADGMKQVI